MSAELFSVSNDLCLAEGLIRETHRRDHTMARVEDRVCLVHEVVERQREQDRDEIRTNFSEVFSRLRSVERQIWWFGGAVAALIFLGDFIPKILKAIGKMP